MNFLKVIVFILLNFPILALSENVKSVNFSPSSVIIGYGQNNQPTFYSFNNSGQVTVANSIFIDNAIATGIAAAKKATCNLKLKPDQVSVSVGFFSAIWETKKFCE
jgi:lipoate-protein ligase A